MAIVSTKRNYTFLPRVSLKPNQVTLYNEVLYNDFGSSELKSIHSGRAGAPLVKQFHNFKVSLNAQRTMKQKINWLYTLSEPRKIKTYAGKDIFKFKMNFITLTLPSAQMHPTAEITTICFNQFITELRQRCNLKNYVWRLEFQSNGNVHYHIATDSYIDYFFAQKVWNRIINKLGYVDTYTKKFKKLTLHEYWGEQSKYRFDKFQQYKGRYEKGIANGWKQPPTIDTKSCHSEKEIASYISKYFGKNDESKCLCSVHDNLENSKSLRLWFCSRSLSTLKSVSEYTERIEINWYDLLKDCATVRELVLDYATCLFFEIKNLSPYIQSLLTAQYKSYGLERQYSSA